MKVWSNPAGIGTRWHDTPTVETASIPIELDFGTYRHAQEVTDCMSIETVATRTSADYPGISR